MVLKMAEDNSWYVCILKFYGSRCYVFTGVGGDNYIDFRENCERRSFGGMRVIAENFSVNDGRIDGVSRKAKNIAVRVQKGEDFDVQKALDGVCAE